MEGIALFVKILSQGRRRRKEEEIQILRSASARSSHLKSRIDSTPCILTLSSRLAAVSLSQFNLMRNRIKLGTGTSTAFFLPRFLSSLTYKGFIEITSLTLDFIRQVRTTSSEDHSAKPHCIRMVSEQDWRLLNSYLQK